jgi:hypothetical protein
MAPPWYPHHSTWETIPTGILVSSWSGWLIPRSSIGPLQMLPSSHHKKRQANSWHCGVFPFKDSNAKNITRWSGRHCSLGTVQCPSEPIPCGSFQSHWHCKTPSIDPTLRDLHNGSPINNNTSCTPNVSRFVTVQEHSPYCPCDNFSPPPHSGSTGPNNAKPVPTPFPVSIWEGEPQTCAISEGGT